MNILSFACAISWAKIITTVRDDSARGPCPCTKALLITLGVRHVLINNCRIGVVRELPPVTSSLSASVPTQYLVPRCCHGMHRELLRYLALILLTVGQADS